MAERWQYAEHNVGPFVVELRRRPGVLQFRPKFTDDPRNLAAVEMNAELRVQGGAWALIPPHLVDEAMAAFTKPEAPDA